MWDSFFTKTDNSGRTREQPWLPGGRTIIVYELRTCYLLIYDKIISCLIFLAIGVGGVISAYIKK